MQSLFIFLGSGGGIIIDVQRLSLFPQARLPSKFKMPDMDKLNGTGCPKTHMKMYVRALQPLSISEDLMAQLFQQTWTGAALKWLLSLEESRTLGGYLQRIQQAISLQHGSGYHSA